jgi:hypothetical protein
MGAKKKAADAKPETEEEKKGRKLNDLKKKYEIVLPEEHFLAVKI